MVADGSTMKMQEMKDGLPVPEKGTVELKPGGYHVMLMNVKKPIAIGDTVQVAVVFKNAGMVAIKAVAQEIQSSSGGMTSGMASPTQSATVAR